MKEPLFIIIDLFCGFGGTTLGFELAELEELKIAEVFACVNHDPKAIKSHWLNNTRVKHFNEDMRTLDLTELIALTAKYRTMYPNAKLILWASLECTNFSKAKGGLPRNADSRTLADHLERYIIAIDPDYIKIENVVEFMSWGPLDENGRPVSKKSGSDWLRWRKEIQALGYVDEWKELNSANFGAYTSRNRLFGVFAKQDMPIAWPIPTHAKVPSKMSMYGDMKKWMPVKDVLNFEDEGESIFTRKKPLSDNTLERIYAGLIKYIAKGDTAFISNYFSGMPSGMNASTDQPAGSITTKDHHSVVQAAFLTKNYSGKPEGKNISVEGPAGTITTFGGSHALVQGKFLVKYNSKGKDGSYNPPSIEEPSPVVSTQNRLYLAQTEFIVQRNTGKPESKLVDIDGPARTLTATAGNQELVQPEFLTHYYSGGGQTSSIEDPCPTVTAMDGKALIQPEPFIMPTAYQNQPKSVDEPAPTITASRRHHYLVSHCWKGGSGSTDRPCCTILACADKSPIYFIQVYEGVVTVPVYDTDSSVAIRIKQFMALYGLIDIKMRMLRVPELLKIQGFPENYKMVGNQSDQKKFIGNSVVPHVVKAWAEAMGRRLLDLNQKVA